MTVIAIGNHKGGVGKTTTTHNLACALADRHRKVLMVDMDSQSSLTAACGITQNMTEDKHIGNVLWVPKGKPLPIESIIIHVGDHLDLAPANLSMANTQLGISTVEIGGATLLKRALAPVLSKYDFILIDTPPGLGKLIVNGMVAAEWVIIPTQPQIIDILGLDLFRETLDILRDGRENPKEMGILFTFYAGYNLHLEAESAIKESGLHLFQTKIGRSVRVAEAPQEGKSVVHYDPANPRAIEYRSLAQEVVECLR